MPWIHSILDQAPEIALFLSVAGGYWIGKFQFGKFQLGEVAGCLLVAVAISQIGVSIDDGVKSFLFALFIYAVGFECGPTFFQSLDRKSIREVLLAVVLAASGLITVIVMAHLSGLDKGLAAGIASGGLTQSAIIGTASSAIGKLALPAEEIQRLQNNVAVGYAVTYIFGTLGPILVCVNLLPWMMKRSIRDDAIKAQTAMLAGTHPLGPGEQYAMRALVGRLYRIEQAAGRTVAEIEAAAANGPVSIERVKRNNMLIGLQPTLRLQTGDIILLVGRRAGVVGLAGTLGVELRTSRGMDVIMLERDVVITNPAYTHRTVAEIRRATADIQHHGVYVTGVKRSGVPLTLTPNTVIESGDIATLYGSAKDVQRVAKSVGTDIIPSDITDWIYHGLGLVLGLLIGLAEIRIGDIPLTLGGGGGALLAGLLFGWYRTRNLTIGNMPVPAMTALRDLGIAGFIAVVGLQSGRQAVNTVAESGLSIFLAGVVVTLVPLLITLLVGRYLLRYDNAAIFAGALAGARSANPAFGEVLTQAGNSIPTVPFVITYALANILLTLLGPLVVAFV